ncbi:MAG: hypothetical protein JSV80_12465 [Acidobacteriota bacterium]|nr:MAG: hypothetical protein JSV80_12465 [Acidobacteriota bacterium]
MTTADLILHLLETARFRASRWNGVGRFRDAREYFDLGEGGPLDDEYVRRLKQINERFPEFLDPGRVEAPDPSVVSHEGQLIRFPSPSPIGDPAVDRVALRVYPAPAGVPPVGVLFHHWIYLDGWRAVDYLLRPLSRRFRVAVMIASHHMMRRRRGFGPGEGMVNPNPRHLLEALRQWQADHAACLRLLARDHGFASTVVLGYSLGGYGTLLSHMLGPALPTVAVCVTNNYGRGVLRSFTTPELRVRLRQAGFTRSSFLRVTRAIHLARWAHRIDTRSLTWISARHDTIEPRESLREPLERLHPERYVELPGGHATAALFRRRIAREVETRVGELMQRAQPADVRSLSPDYP